MYLMNKVFIEFLDKFVVVFIDDILVFVAPGFKNKTRYTPYVSLESQI